jgi:dCTP deaminase
MLKSDRWIKEQAAMGMISPFEPSCVRHIKDLPPGMKIPAISYGCSSYGYDLQLSPKEFKIYRHIPGRIVDPKRFDPRCLETLELNHDPDTGESYFIHPHKTYALGVALNHLIIPDGITCLFIGKSTYARCGIIANLTPGEAGWRGHLTIELYNGSDADARVYAGEGIVQALFFEGDPCDVTYADRAGKYQDQPHQIVTARS